MLLLLLLGQQQLILSPFHRDTVQNFTDQQQ
jgi:hypothetical protein